MHNEGVSYIIIGISVEHKEHYGQTLIYYRREKDKPARGKAIENMRKG